MVIYLVVASLKGNPWPRCILVTACPKHAHIHCKRFVKKEHLRVESCHVIAKKVSMTGVVLKDFFSEENEATHLDIVHVLRNRV